MTITTNICKTTTRTQLNMLHTLSHLIIPRVHFHEEFSDRILSLLTVGELKLSVGIDVSSSDKATELVDGRAMFPTQEG